VKSLKAAWATALVLAACTSSVTNHPDPDTRATPTVTPTVGPTANPLDCGNNQLDAGEECDGEELGGESCVTLGFASGSLTCKANCSIDDSACVTAPWEGNLCDHASVIFCEDFEAGNLAKWNDMDGNSEITVPTDAGPFVRGENHVARLWLPPGRGTADLNRYYESEDRGWDKLYLRWYQKWEAGYDFAAWNHGSGLEARDSSYPYRSSGYIPLGYDNFSASFEPNAGAYGHTEWRARMFLYTYYPDQYMNCADPEGSCWGDELPCISGTCDVPEHRPDPMPPQMQAGVWYCLQMMVDAGTTGPTGSVNFWIDGAEYGPWENLRMRDTEALQINNIHMTLFHHDEHADAGFRIDDVIAATQPIPCGPIQ